VDRGKFFKRDSWRGYSFNPQKRAGSTVVTEDGIGEDIDPFYLNEKGGVTDPGYLYLG
jgi:hypothetical protein